MCHCKRFSFGYSTTKRFTPPFTTFLAREERSWHRNKRRDRKKARDDKAAKDAKEAKQAKGSDRNIKRRSIPDHGYFAFVSHMKAEAAMEARFLQIELEALKEDELVFLDSDDLRDLLDLAVIATSKRVNDALAESARARAESERACAESENMPRWQDREDRVYRKTGVAADGEQRIRMRRRAHSDERSSGAG